MAVVGGTARKAFHVLLLHAWRAKQTLFYLALRLEWNQVYYYCGHCINLLYQPLMRYCDDCIAVSTMKGYQWKLKYSEKTCASAALSTTDPTWLEQGSNPGRRGGIPTTNRLSYGTACETSEVGFEFLEQGTVFRWGNIWQQGNTEHPWRQANVAVDVSDHTRVYEWHLIRT
jgi:hypothetical protein